MSAEIYDNRPCRLGEGPLWHPHRQELFWFDILNCRLHSVSRTWQFGEMVSAAGWIDQNTLLIASETQLFTFDLESGTQNKLVALEADLTQNRSNDGRADPWGGFWIGTMSKSAAPKQGAIYRYFQSKLTKLYSDISISNGICFAPNQSCAYFSDTPTGQVMQVCLDEEGWPVGAPEVFLDLRKEGLNPDGAVTDADGTYWLAQWGASRIAAYGADGVFKAALSVTTTQSSCPALSPGAFFVTSSADGVDEADGGKTFRLATNAPFKPEPGIIL